MVINPRFDMIVSVSLLCPGPHPLKILPEPNAVMLTSLMHVERQMFLLLVTLIFYTIVTG